MIDVIICN